MHFVRAIRHFCVLGLLGLWVGQVNAAPILWVADSGSRLGTVDVATGDVTVIGSMGTIMTDIAFDPSGQLYGISFTSLYRIDKNTAAITFVGGLGTVANSLVFDSAGTLYTANSNLYTINTSTGAATLVGGGGGYTSSGDLAFSDGELFLTATPNGSSDRLFKLNPATGAGTLVGNIGWFDVFGLASPNGFDLYGLSGTSVVTIDPSTGAGFLNVYYGNKGLGPAFGSAFLSEAVVPIPGALVLLGSGLIALITGARRRAR